MGSSAQERIALAIDATANVTEIAKARSEVSALGDAAKKAFDTAGESATLSTTRINAEIGAFERMGQTIDKTSLTAVRNYRAMGDALAGVLTKAGATEQEINRLGTAIAKVERGAGAASLPGILHETNIALDAVPVRTRTAARGLEMLTQAAITGHGSMAGVATAAGNLSTGLATMSGSAALAASATGIGALIAVLTLGIGIFEHFRAEADKNTEAINKFRTSLEEAQRAGLREVSEKTQTIYSGDPFAIRKQGESAASFISRSEGLEGVRRKIAEINALEDAANAKYSAAIGDVTERNRALLELNRINFKLRNDLIPIEARLAQEYRDALPALARANALEAERAKNAADRKREEFEARMAARGVGTLPVDGAAGGRRELGEFAFGLIGEEQRQSSQIGLLRAQEGELMAELTKTNLAYAKRISLMQELAKVRTEIDDVGLVSTRGLHIRAAKILPTESQGLVDTFNKTVNEPLARAVQSGLTSTLGDAFSAGLSAAFNGENIGAAFKSAGRAILAGLGGIISQMGDVWLQYGISMTALGDALWNPLTSGPAAIGIGIALKALGSALGAVAHQTRGGGGGAAGSGSTFVPSSAASGGSQTIIVQVGDVANAALVNTVTYQINRNAILGKPVIAPYGRAA